MRHAEQADRAHFGIGIAPMPLVNFALIAALEIFAPFRILILISDLDRYVAVHNGVGSADEPQHDRLAAHEPGLPKIGGPGLIKSPSRAEHDRGRGYQQDRACDPGSPALPPALLRIAILHDCLHRLRLRHSRDDPANDQPNLPADANPPSLPVMAKNCATLSSMISPADLTLSIRPADCPASAGAASMSPWK